MKIFGRYNPLQIARYVKIFFRGHLYIKGVGAFEFDQGRLQLPKKRTSDQLGVMSEVNRRILQLRMTVV